MAEPQQQQHEQDGQGKRVLVSGASGYIAGHIIRELLAAGYRVRGTVRDPNKASSTNHLKKIAEGAQYPLELVKANLLEKECWDEAVKDVDYVLHTASPFTVESPKDPQVLIKPAVEGTLSVLRAVAAYNAEAEKKIQRVIVTSSIAAVMGGHEKDPKYGPDHVYTAEDWTDVEAKGVTPYLQSKTLAERAAWEFQKECKPEESFELATINPSYVQGPMYSAKGCASQELVERILTRQMPGVPRIGLNIVDVRDIATAHVRAMVHPEAAGQRFICHASDTYMTDVAKVLAAEFDPQGYNCPTKRVPKPFLYVASLFDKALRTILPGVDKQQHFDSSPARDVLGIDFIGFKKSCIDMGYSMIDLGVVPDKRKKNKGKKKGGKAKM